MMNKIIRLIGLFFALVFLCNVQSFAKSAAPKTPTEILSAIDNYQAQYFEIIKRNDMLLKWEEDSTLKKDRKELKKIFKNVRKQITNKDYLKKYDDIEKKYAKCEDMTTFGMDKFAHDYYKEVDALLNEVYKQVKTKISAEDFKKLVLSERKWLKDVKAYKNVYSEMGFGTIGTLIYYDYETNMRQFRVLLLMLYL